MFQINQSTKNFETRELGVFFTAAFVNVFKSSSPSFIHEFHGDTSLKQNFRAAVNVTY